MQLPALTGLRPCGRVQVHALAGWLHERHIGLPWSRPMPLMVALAGAVTAPPLPGTTPPSPYPAPAPRVARTACSLRAALLAAACSGPLVSRLSAAGSAARMALADLCTGGWGTSTTHRLVLW